MGDTNTPTPSLPGYTFVRTIGKGNFGEVGLYNYTGSDQAIKQMCTSEGHIAVKFVKEVEQTEIDIGKQLLAHAVNSKSSSPFNLTTPIEENGKTVAIACKYVAYDDNPKNPKSGDLAQFLLDVNNNLLNSDGNKLAESFNHNNIAITLAQLANSMHQAQTAMHNAGVFHLDTACRNFLMNKPTVNDAGDILNVSLTITDYGFSRKIPDNGIIVIDRYEGYNFASMSALPQNNSANAVSGIVYLDEKNGKYVVRDPKGIVQEGSLDTNKFDLSKVLQDPHNLELKSSVLAVTSKAGHTEPKQFPIMAMDQGIVGQKAPHATIASESFSLKTAITSMTGMALGAQDESDALQLGNGIREYLKARKTLGSDSAIQEKYIENVDQLVANALPTKHLEQVKLFIESYRDYLTNMPDKTLDWHSAETQNQTRLLEANAKFTMAMLKQPADNLESAKLQIQRLDFLPVADKATLKAKDSYLDSVKPAAAESNKDVLLDQYKDFMNRSGSNKKDRDYLKIGDDINSGAINTVEGFKKAIIDIIEKKVASVSTSTYAPQETSSQYVSENDVTENEQSRSFRK